MKKLLLLFVMCVSILGAANETLKNGEVIEYTPGSDYETYVLKVEKNGKNVRFECEVNVLYIYDYRAKAITHNPYTSNPYYCEYELRKKDNLFGERNVNKITIYYNFEDVEK